MNLQAVPIGQYIPGHSLLHRLDPRTKIIGTFLFSVLVFLPKTWPGFALLTGFALVAAIGSRVPIRFILSGLKPILFFLAIAVVLNAFMTPGQPIFQLGSVQVTREGLTSSLVASLRLILLVVVASLLTLTTSPIRLTDGLERLLRPLAPLGVPAHELALMMTIALRFIPTLMEEADRIIRAQTARGADFQSGNLMNRVRGLIPVMVPLFVASFRRADELATAMEARGYRGGHGRTKMKELHFAAPDYAVLVLMLLFTAAVVYLRVRKVG